MLKCSADGATRNGTRRCFQAAEFTALEVWIDSMPAGTRREDLSQPDVRFDWVSYAKAHKGFQTSMPCDKRQRRAANKAAFDGPVPVPRTTHGARTDVDGRQQLGDPFSQQELPADQASGLCSEQAASASGSVNREPHSPPHKPEPSHEEVVKAMRLALQQAKKEPDTGSWLFGLHENRRKTDEDAGEDRVKTEGAEDTQSEGATLKSAPTCAKTESGTNICKAWNDARGCSGQRCPKGKAHVCDIKLLESKNPCGRTDHSRRSHDANKHGAIAFRD